MPLFLWSASLLLPMLFLWPDFPVVWVILDWVFLLIPSETLLRAPPRLGIKSFFICIGIEIRAFLTWIGYHAWLWELSPEMLRGSIFVLKFSLDSLSFFTVSSYVDRGSWSLWNLLLYLYSIEFPFSLSICFDVSCKLFSDILPVLLPDLYSFAGPSPQINGQ